MMRVLCLLALILLEPVSAKAGALTVCAEPDPPPLTYWVRDKSGKPGNMVTGYSVDLIKEVFEKIGREAMILPLPWQRCRQYLLNGKIDFQFDAYPDDFVGAEFTLSHHYKTLTPQIFFDRVRPIKVRVKADLKHYHGCGLSGSSYASFGLSEKNLDLDSQDDASLIRKLEAGHCDYFIEDLEVMGSYRLIGTDYLADERLAHVGLIDAIPSTLHFAARRGSEAAALIPALDKAIGEIVESGEAAKIWDRHAPGIPFVP